MIGVLAALTLAAAPARAADQTVTATFLNTFSPRDVSVDPGDTVTWSNGGGIHNVHFDDGSFVMPPAPQSSSWSVPRTFDSPGTFRYYCDEHGLPGGVGMAGTVTVQGAGASPGPGAGPDPGPGSAPGYPPQPVTADTIAPALKLRGRKTQRALRQRAVVVAVAVDEASTVVARGTVRRPGAGRSIRLRRATRRLAAGARANLRLKLSKRNLHALRRALGRRPRLTAGLSVTATDAAGNRRSATRNVTLRR